MKRWLSSRWMVTSWLFGAAAFYLAIRWPTEGGIETFGTVAAVALAGGHFTNGIRESRGHPTVQPPPDREDLP